MKLSILMCTLPTPYRDNSFFIDISEQIMRHIYNKPIEFLYLGDNKSMSVGEKRNHLMRISSGERIIFIDDDDQITDNYLSKVFSYCDLDFDCIGIGVEFTKNGKDLATYDYSYKKNINTRQSNKKLPNFGKRVYGRMPNHLCLWKREIALRCMFPDRNLGEDHEWAEQQLLQGYTLHLTEEIIYHYDFRIDNTQTRIRR